MVSKEENILALFFNESSKHWHFENIVKASKVSRDKASKWLARFVKEGIIKKFKPDGKMPYYIGNFEHPSYRNRKRLYALNLLYKTGFLNHLMSLQKARTVILFGSFARADWYSDSDIDLFIYGEDDELEQGKYERRLHREIQVFTAKNKEDLKKFRHGLLTNIATGYFVKGKLDFAEVCVPSATESNITAHQQHVRTGKQLKSKSRCTLLR